MRGERPSRKENVAQKAQAVKRERQSQKELRAIERSARRAQRKPQVSAREKRSESDDEVRGNISPELVPLFERVKRQIKSSARKSRTEAFLQYVEEHPDEAMAAIDDKTEAVIRDLQRQDRTRRPLARAKLSAPPSEPSNVDDVWGGLLNPGGASLVLLGKLTALEYESAGRRRVLRWSLRSAPLLAYDRGGRLHVVFGASARGKASSDARSEYRRTHWGRGGRGQILSGRELAGPFRGVKRLGRSTRITYTTRKGFDSDLTDYVHQWGEGARGSFEAPIVVAQSGMIALSGGTYRVTARGIVG